MRGPYRSIGVGWLGAVLLACGGGEPDGPAGSGPGVQVPQHPLGAQLVTEAEFEALAERGDLQPVEALSAEDEATRVAMLQADAEAAIDAFVQSNPRAPRELLRPVTSPRAVPTDDGQNLELDLGDQTVIVQGPGMEARSVARALALQRDPGAQRNVLDALVGVAPAPCASYAPDDPSTRTAEDLASINAEIAECTFDWWSLVGLFGDGETTPYSESVVIAPECDPDYDVGVGNDGADSCGASVPLPSWPFNDALPPVRSQGRRGSCVAFAAASALEYTTARFTGETIDISEQDAYAKGKFALYQEHFTDGLPTQDYLFALAGLGLPLSLEEDWGYNPSWCRGVDLETLTWAESCVGYSGAACSDTSHQLGLVAASLDDAYWFLPEVGPSFVTVEGTQSLP
ncbi:MAG: C1 family peptidase, partial [Myxococcota bacterium]